MVQPKLVEDGSGNLVITIPLKTALKERQESSTGKSLMLCSISERFDSKAVGGMIRVGLNVFQKNPAHLAESDHRSGPVTVTRT